MGWSDYYNEKKEIRIKIKIVYLLFKMNRNSTWGTKKKQIKKEKIGFVLGWMPRKERKARDEAKGVCVMSSF